MTKYPNMAKPGRRLEGGVNSKSKWGGHEAKKLAELEKSRDRLSNLVSKYIELLTDKTLPSNKSQQDKENQRKILDEIASSALELDILNVREGTTSVFLTSLNSVLVLRDELNKTRYQNYLLDKEIKILKSQLSELASTKEEKAGSDEQD